MAGSAKARRDIFQAAALSADLLRVREVLRELALAGGGTWPTPSVARRMEVLRRAASGTGKNPLDLAASAAQTSEKAGHPTGALAWVAAAVELLAPSGADGGAG